MKVSYTYMHLTVLLNSEVCLNWNEMEENNYEVINLGTRMSPMILCVRLFNFFFKEASESIIVFFFREAYQLIKKFCVPNSCCFS